MPGRLIQRHDQFFKRLLDQPGAAGALLHERLPPEIARHLSAEPPELLPGSFVPAELREYRTDRLYRVRLDSAGPALLVHCVVEHKSTPDPRIGLQLLGYKAQILDWWDRTEGRDTDGRRQPLPPVVSVVVYHGQADWQVPLSLADAVAGGAGLRPWLADFRYILVDLGRIDDARLSGSAVLRTGLLILKYGTSRGDLRDTLLTLGRAALALGFDDLVALIRYVLAEPNDVEAGILRSVLADIMPGQEERIMSIAAEQWKAQWTAEGRAEGRTEGISIGKADMLLRQLHRRFGRVSPELEALVNQADSGQLDHWMDRLMDAGSLTDIFPGRPPQ